MASREFGGNMRTVRIILSFAGLALPLLAGHALFSQAVTSVHNGRVTQGFGTGTGPSARKIEPYTAIRKTTRVQKLADGATITHETTVKEARDSSGRTYRENRSAGAPGAEEASQVVFVTVHDPVNRVNITWNSNSTEAILTHFAEPGDIRIRGAVSSNMPSAPTVRAEIARPEIEDLGIKTINGFEAKGTRTTRVIPAGRDGNDEPITVTQESWFSSALRMPVMTIGDDPRTGTSTMELTEIERAEPDPALFQIPEGYTVKERTPEQPN